MRSNRKNAGFTMAEMLITIAIIGVLAALAFISVIGYLRDLTKLQYDGYAKEIFVAAQNHLSMAKSQGYLGLDKSTDTKVTGFKELPVEGMENETGNGVYYFVVTDPENQLKEQSILSLMLPFGSVDDTIRMGGQYIIRYHKDAGTVLDVFYWDPDGRYPYTYPASTDNAAYYTLLKDSREHPEWLKKYPGGTGNSIIGFYGGENAKKLAPGDELVKPKIKVKNAEKLTVTITDGNTTNDPYNIKLLITGVTSKANKEVIIKGDGQTPGFKVEPLGSGKYSVNLDDITKVGGHFYALFCTSANFIPGEDITIQAVAYNNDALTNVAYSSKRTTNSLFASIKTTKTTNKQLNAEASITNIRHLENLDDNISNLKASQGKINFTSAVQKSDLDINFTDAAAGGGLSEAKGAGLFGTLNGKTIRNLKLVDFKVTGSGNTGALAGATGVGTTGDGTTISNVVAFNTDNGNDYSATEPTISGGTNTGGLIGSTTAGKVEKSAAALVVNSSENAGGLIGTAAGTEVTECFSGGHTVKGDYKEVKKNNAIVYNVTATDDAGGLIGDAGDSTIEYSYSTCSAKGALVGGLVGYTSGTINNCYATGLVADPARQDDPAQKETYKSKTANEGAFAGSCEGTISNCRYYQIINERLKEDGKGFEYLDAIGSGSKKANASVTAIDYDAANYNGFVGTDWRTAIPYDTDLVKYYQGKYNLKTVQQLAGNEETFYTTTTTDQNGKLHYKTFVVDHYGDWPAPEIFIINQ